MTSELAVDGGSKSSHLPRAAAYALLDHETAESMSGYFKRLSEEIDSKLFEKVDKIEADGLYIGKRAIRGAEGQGDLLNQAGTVFYHTLMYLRENGKTYGLDFGPRGDADVTANVMEAVKCAPIVSEDPAVDPESAMLYLKTPVIKLQDPLAQRAIQFAQLRQYHAVYNNCIENTDFLTRIFTLGKVKSIPLVYDALVGKVPEQDHPMLVMFFLMTNMSWYDICDGSAMVAEFLGIQNTAVRPELQAKDSIKLPKGLVSAAADARRGGSVDFDNLINSIDEAAKKMQLEKGKNDAKV